MACNQLDKAPCLDKDRRVATVDRAGPPVEPTVVNAARQLVAVFRRETVVHIELHLLHVQDEQTSQPWAACCWVLWHVQQEVS